jgi:hypothetical protein
MSAASSALQAAVPWAGLAETAGTLVMGLLAAHDRRVTAAKEENAAVQQAVVALDSDLATIFDAANKGDITPQVAAAACMDVHNWYWLFIQPLQQGSTKGPQQVFPNPGAPNNADTGGIYYEATDGANCHCGTDKNCTAGCCIGCAAIDPCLSNAYKFFSTGKAFTLHVPVIVANKYGLAQRAAYDLKFTPPVHENPEAEVALNTKTGIITVGATPSGTDAVIATGVTTSGAPPDTGGDSIQHTAAGTDNPATTVSASAFGNLFNSIPGGMTTVIIGLIVVVLLAMVSRPKQQAVVIAQPA